MEYMLARIEDAWLRMENGEFTNNILEAESFSSFEEAKEYVTEDTIVICIKPNNIN